jgi:glycerol-3-phosphate dehydrogenase subunit C
MSTEGETQAPIRHAIPWESPDFYDPGAIDEELRRVFDICHGCRRCFNLCDSFPRLFDLIDASPTGELDGVDSADFAPVVEACTLCDLCFIAKCPYVPPHAFDLDFPHLMLRARAADHQTGKTPWVREQITQTDRNGALGCKTASLANWALKTENTPVRKGLEAVSGIHARADLPSFQSQTFVSEASKNPPSVNSLAPGFGEKVLLYATCFVNYNDASVGRAAQAVLAKNGIETVVLYPECCGMPQWEHGDIQTVAEKALKIKEALLPWVSKGYTIVPLVPSCTLMITMEWPLLWPEDPEIRTLVENTQDLPAYIVGLARRHGLAPGLTSFKEGVTLHVACHARAQNQGRKGEELLKLIPDTDVTVIERCSGHGGSWGIFKENFDVALKVGKPVARKANEASCGPCVSECPLAARHIQQGREILAETQGKPSPQPMIFTHPIQILAHAWGLSFEDSHTGSL